MKKLMCVALVLGLLLAAVPAMAGDNGRYVFTAVTSKTDDGHIGYVLDTQTGKLWGLVPAINQKLWDPKIEPPYFLELVLYQYIVPKGAHSFTKKYNGTPKSDQ